MTIDKRINYRGGGASDTYQGGSGAPGSAEAGKTVGRVGGPSYDSGPSVDYDTGRKQFAGNLNRNNAARFNQSQKSSFFPRKYKPVNLNQIGYRNQLPGFQESGLGKILMQIAGVATGIPLNMSNAKSKFTNFMGDQREKLTGYRTQQEYDDARQGRINLDRIDTIQNTLDRKYSDGDYSDTDLDERLADLKQSMGIVPNTANQNAQQFLDFGNELAENTEQTMLPQNTSESYINSTSSTNPVGGLNQYRKEMEALTKRGEDYYFPDELGGTLQDFYLNKNPLPEGNMLDLSETEMQQREDEFGPNPFLPLKPTNFNTDQSGITNSDVASEFMQVGMNEAQKNKALQEMGFGVPADKIIPKLQQLDETKFGFFKTEDAIKAMDLIKFYEDRGIKLSDDQKIKIIKAAGEEEA